MKSKQYRETSLANLKQGRVRREPRVIKNDNSANNAQSEAADKFGVSAGMVAQAGQIRRADPVVFDQVKDGHLSIQQAKRQIVTTAGRSTRGSSELIAWNNKRA